MKNKWIVLGLLLLSVTLCSCMPKPRVPIGGEVKSVEYYLPKWETEEHPEKRIEILRFHHTVECKDCATIGQFVIFLLKKEYQKECESGLIIYRSVNSDLLENKSLLDKYNVLEEDFVINVVNGEKESIVHDEEPFKLAKNGKDLTPYLRKVFSDGLKSLQ
jgi:hypothetical protein